MSNILTLKWSTRCQIFCQRGHILLDSFIPKYDVVLVLFDDIDTISDLMTISFLLYYTAISFQGIISFQLGLNLCLQSMRVDVNIGQISIDIEEVRYWINHPKIGSHSFDIILAQIAIAVCQSLTTYRSISCPPLFLIVRLSHRHLSI